MFCKKLLVGTLAVFALMGTAPLFAADSGSGGGGGYHSSVNEQYSWIIRWFWHFVGHLHNQDCGHGDASSGGSSSNEVAMVPELNAANAGLSLALMAGLILLVRETRKRRR